MSAPREEPAVREERRQAMSPERARPSSAALRDGASVTFTLTGRPSGRGRDGLARLLRSVREGRLPAAGSLETGELVGAFAGIPSGAGALGVDGVALDRPGETYLLRVSSGRAPARRVSMGWNREVVVEARRIDGRDPEVPAALFELELAPAPGRPPSTRLATLRSRPLDAVAGGTAGQAREITLAELTVEGGEARPALERLALAADLERLLQAPRGGRPGAAEAIAERLERLAARHFPADERTAQLAELARRITQLEPGDTVPDPARPQRR